MKIAFFDVDQIDEERIKQVFPAAQIIAEPLNTDTVEQAHEAEIVSVFVGSDVSEKVITELKHLRHINCRSTGFNHVDLKSAAGRNISISTVPSYGENTVAEYAFGLLLSLVRKLPIAIDQIHDGEIDHTQTTGFDLMNKTLGVVGTGRIGTHAISIGHGFGMKVVGFDPFPKLELEGQLGFRYVDFHELLKQSDIITVHAPLTPDTHHLFDAAAFRKMKSSVVIVNTARGEIIDTGALTEALHKKQIAGAALDVIEGETLLNTDDELQLLTTTRSRQKLELAAEIAALEKLPNVIITPHNAFNTTEAVGRIWQTSFENIRDYIAGKPSNLVKTR